MSLENTDLRSKKRYRDVRSFMKVKGVESMFNRDIPAHFDEPFVKSVLEAFYTGRLNLLNRSVVGRFYPTNDDFRYNGMAAQILFQMDLNDLSRYVTMYGNSNIERVTNVINEKIPILNQLFNMVKVSNANAISAAEKEALESADDPPPIRRGISKQAWDRIQADYVDIIVRTSDMLIRICEPLTSDDERFNSSIDVVKAVHKKAKIYLVLLGAGVTDIPDDVLESEYMSFTDILDEVGVEGGLYENSENIHYFESEIDSFVNTFVRSEVPQMSLVDCVNEIHAFTRIIQLNDEDRSKCIASIDRITDDESRFSSLNLTLGTIMCMIWTHITLFTETPSNFDLIERIHTEETNSASREETSATIINTLKRRFIEELSEMSDTCGTGHVQRFCNVFSAFSDKPPITLQWRDEISLAAEARMSKLIKESSSPMKHEIALAMIGDVSDEIYAECKVWMDEIIEIVRNDLMLEYVGQGFMKEDEYNKYFSRVREKYSLE